MCRLFPRGKFAAAHRRKSRDPPWSNTTPLSFVYYPHPNSWLWLLAFTVLGVLVAFFPRGKLRLLIGVNRGNRFRLRLIELVLHLQKYGRRNELHSSSCSARTPSTRCRTTTAKSSPPSPIYGVNSDKRKKPHADGPSTPWPKKLWLHLHLDDPA